MNDNQLDSVQLVLKRLREKMDGPGDGKKWTFWDGDPGEFPMFDLPAICVDLATDTTDRVSTHEADVVDRVVIKVVFNRKDDVDNVKNKTPLTHRRILDAIGARDAETGKFREGTVKGALQGRLDGDRRLGKRISVQYGLAPRPNKQVTAEGQVTIEVLHSVYVD